MKKKNPKREKTERKKKDRDKTEKKQKGKNEEERENEEGSKQIPRYYQFPHSKKRIR